MPVGLIKENDLKEKDIIVIPDTQVRAGVCTAHLDAVSKYIWRHKPEYVVHLGDHFDMDSISYYASKRESEGKRVIDDVRSGKEALTKIMAFTHERNKKAKGKTYYMPELHFCLGNHEQRWQRVVNQQPWLEGVIDLEEIIELNGWTVHSF